MRGEVAGIAVAILLVGTPQACAAQDAPPTARRSTEIQVVQGLEVADPYRWMEKMSSDEVTAWARRQDELARGYAAAAPLHDRLRRDIAASAEHERFLAPAKRGGWYFYPRVNSSFTQVSILAQEGLGGEPREIVSGEKLQTRGLSADRSVWPSPDGRIIAYGVSPEASRWMEIRFRRVDDGAELPDRIVGLQNSLSSRLSWAPDGSGVYYDGFDPPVVGGDTREHRLAGARLAFHRLGTESEEDRILLEASEIGTTIRHWLSDDGRWLGAAIRDAGRSGDRVYLFEAGGMADPITLVADGAAPFEFAGSRGDEVWLYTNAGAPNGRVIGIDANDPRPEAWRDVVAEQDAPIDTWTGIKAVGDYLVGGYRNQGLLELRAFEPGENRGRVLDLPRIGSVWFGVEGRQGDPEIFFVLSGFADPGTVYRHDLETGRTSVFRSPDVPFDPARIETRLVTYRTASGRDAPMYLAHLAGVELDGSRPVMMYGYGFGGWSVSPWFRPHMSEWFRMGGGFALPALRGGGEFGEEWTDAGHGVNRQNAVDDYIAAAEWLIDEGLARPGLLVAETNSAGGPVVGDALLQRPELFRAAILAFPLLDLLRYHEFTGGARWIPYLGSIDDPDQAPVLVALSPVHNVEGGACYPATLITPGERDETTPPFHAYKFAAALQHAQACDRPVLLRMSWGAGHAYGRDQESTVDNLADQLSFLARQFDFGDREDE